MSILLRTIGVACLALFVTACQMLPEAANNEADSHPAAQLVVNGKEKLYVLAESLPFVVEITADKDRVAYIAFVIANASIR